MTSANKRCGVKLTFLITAGPTREYLDPVRYISNASSGKMGYALAGAARKKGHNVIIVSGPVECRPPRGVSAVPVVSAREMLAQAKKAACRADIIIGAAAVADYRPCIASREKIKRTARVCVLKLVPNPDIIGTLGRMKGKRVVVGFALESNNIFTEAERKLKEKNLDMIVANTPASIGNSRASVWLLKRDKSITALKENTKAKIAESIIDETVRIWQNRRARKKIP